MADETPVDDRDDLLLGVAALLRRAAEDPVKVHTDYRVRFARMADALERQVRPDPTRHPSDLQEFFAVSDEDIDGVRVCGSPLTSYRRRELMALSVWLAQRCG